MRGFNLIRRIGAAFILFSRLVWWYYATEDQKMDAPVATKATVCGITSDEFLLFSSVVEAESDRSSDVDSKVYIALVILNRADPSNYEFPDSITGVIYDPGQFEVISNGAVSCGNTNSSDMAVIKAYEWIERGDAPNVMYFNNSGYAYGTPYGYFGGNYFVTVP